MLTVADHARRCADLSDAIAPFIAQIDAEIARDLEDTIFQMSYVKHVHRDGRAQAKDLWALHHKRTQVLREERERIIQNAANILSVMSPCPVVVTYQGEPVQP